MGMCIFLLIPEEQVWLLGEIWRLWRAAWWAPGNRQAKGRRAKARVRQPSLGSEVQKAVQAKARRAKVSDSSPVWGQGSKGRRLK